MSSSASARALTDITWARAAASSMASGSPSSRRQIAGRCRVLRPPSGSRRRPVRRDPRTAARRARPPSSLPRARAGGTLSGRTVTTASPGTCSWWREVTRKVRSGQGATTAWTDRGRRPAGAGRRRTTSSWCRVRSASTMVGRRRRRRIAGDAEGGGERRHQVLRPGDATESAASGPRRRSPGLDRQHRRQPGLAHAARTGQRDQPVIGEQRPDRGQVGVSSQQRVGEGGRFDRGPGARRRCDRRLGEQSGEEPLALGAGQSEGVGEEAQRGHPRASVGPRSSRDTASGLRPARAASPSCDMPARWRYHRSSLPNVLTRTHLVGPPSASP